MNFFRVKIGNKSVRCISILITNIKLKLGKDVTTEKMEIESFNMI